MRKIEADMIAAVKSHRSWKSGNTQVQISPKDGSAHVYLHGNPIAIECKNGWMISDCGWQTTTTKSRLNALLGAVIDRPVSIGQRNYVWRLYDASKSKVIEECDINLVQF